MDKHLLTLILLVSFSNAFAQVPVEKSPYRVSRISTEYFGPYAFPVPELLEGNICDQFHLELSGDHVKGNLGGGKDITEAATFKASIPLWTDRAALSVWGEMHEWYRDTPATRAARRVSEAYPLKGNSAGTVYFSLDMLLMKETEARPSLALRAATQSATGDKYEIARHYDAPGYFFDISSGKSFRVRNGAVRASATAGFVCWQIDRGKQNDAFMLGAKISYTCPAMTLSAEYAGYSGLESSKDPEAGDSPRSFRTEASFHFGKISPFMCWQKGVSDWPFSLIRAGVAVDLDIMK